MSTPNRIGGCSTYGDKRHPPVPFIVVNARRLWIKHRLPIHQESILVMTVCERHLEEPPTVHAPLHGMGAGIPFIEIADQIYGFRSRCATVEIDRFDHTLGRIEGAAGILMQDIHRQVLASLLV